MTKQTYIPTAPLLLPTMPSSLPQAINMDASTSAIQANLRHIAKFEAKLPPNPLPDTAVTEAFGAWAYPKIVSELA